jgi:uncharacterized protein (TIGR02996 family)
MFWFWRFTRVLTEEDIPFIQAILASPKEPGPRLDYADWLERHGQRQRAEFLRLWVEYNISSRPESHTGDLAKRYLRAHDGVRSGWVGFVRTWESRAEVDARNANDDWGGETTDAELGFGPCCICGRAKNFRGCVSRMPCEKCDRVFCWQCADTGVYGSLPDFRHFIEGSFTRKPYHLDRTCCLFCQKMSWMKSHGG